MPHTLIDQVGTSFLPTLSGTTASVCYGPPVHGAPRTRGVFIWQSGTGTSRTYRWIGDEPLSVSVATPTSYTHQA